MSKVVLTVACPEADRDDATNLGVALGWIEGWSPEEWTGCFTAQYQDAQSNLYRVMSMPVGATFIANAVAMGPVERPAQDVEPYVVNLTAARRAQAKLVTWSGTGDVPQVGTDKIVAIAGMSGTAALAAMGLQALPMEI